MSNGSDTQLESMDSATLTPLVQQALGSETIEVADWQCQQIYGGAGGVSGSRRVYRCTGNVQDQGQTVDWSLILKTIRPRPSRGDPSSRSYWKREVLAYQSGLLDDLPGGLAAPQCFGIVEHLNGECWIWMEDVTDHIGPQWPLEHYGVVAGHLGQFNGAYLVGRPVPCHPWLSRGWLRGLGVDGSAGAMSQLPDFLGHRLVGRAYPDDVTEGLLHLWTERQIILDALNRLPQTFCHMDAFRRNLFARHSADGRDQTVAIGWTYAGMGAVGEEPVPLVAASLLGHEVTTSKALELDRMVFDGYLDGLREAGWGGDQRTVRLGYAVASAMRYSFMGVRMWLNIARDEGLEARWERMIGISIEEWADVEREVTRFLLGLADEARGLMDEL
jgi:hypothetical protein